MKKPDNKTERSIAYFLLVIVVLLSIAWIVTFLESEELAHGRPASGWYVHLLDSISLIEFSP